MNGPTDGSAFGVKSALVHLCILIAMLFAGVAVPVAAHGNGALMVAAVGHADSHSSHADDQHQDSDRQDDGQDGIAPHHHHCPAGLTALAPVVTDGTFDPRLAPHVMATARLDSRALAPLTEPPAA